MVTCFGHMKGYLCILSQNYNKFIGCLESLDTIDTSSCSVIVRVSVVLKRTVGDSDSTIDTHKCYTAISKTVVV